MKKLVSILIGAALLTGSCAGWAQTYSLKKFVGGLKSTTMSQDPLPVQSTLLLSPASISVGDFLVNTQVGAFTAVTIQGDTPLTLALPGLPLGLQYTGDTTCVNGSVMQGGQSCLIAMQVSASSVGQFTRTFTVNEQPVTVSGSAFSAGQLGVALGGSTDLSFGSVVVNKSATRSVTLQNTGGAPLSLTTDPNQLAHFEVSTTCPASLAPGQTCTLSFVFTAPYADAVYTTYTYGGVPFSLTAEGVAPGNLSDNLAASAYPFPDTVVNTGTSKQVIFTNTGGVNVSGVAVNSSLTSPFAITNNTCQGQTIVSGGTCTITVSFNPMVTQAWTTPQIVDLTFSSVGESLSSQISFTGSGVAAPDPNWANVVAQYKFNGSGADDKGLHALSITGAANIGTGTVKYGTGALCSNGSTTFSSTVANSADFNFGNGDFTAEGWFNLTSTARYHALLGQWYPGGWLMEADNDGIVRFYYKVGSTTYNQSLGSYTAGTWNHFAVSRSGTTLKGFRNGVQTFSITAPTIDTSSGPLYVLAYSDTTYAAVGCADDIRITKGVGRYTSAFTPNQLP